MGSSNKTNLFESTSDNTMTTRNMIRNTNDRGLRNQYIDDFNRLQDGINKKLLCIEKSIFRYYDFIEMTKEALKEVPISNTRVVLLTKMKDSTIQAAVIPIEVLCNYHPCTMHSVNMISMDDRYELIDGDCETFGIILYIYRECGAKPAATQYLSNEDDDFIYDNGFSLYCWKQVEQLCAKLKYWVFKVTYQWSDCSISYHRLKYT